MALGRFQVNVYFLFGGLLLLWFHEAEGAELGVVGGLMILLGICVGLILVDGLLLDL